MSGRRDAQALVVGLERRREIAGAFLREGTPWDEEVFVRAMDYEVKIFAQELWWDEVYRRMQDELDAALTGRESVAESLAQAHEITNAYLDRFYAEEGDQ